MEYIVSLLELMEKLEPFFSKFFIACSFSVGFFILADRLIFVVEDVADQDIVTF